VSDTTENRMAIDGFDRFDDRDEADAEGRTDCEVGGALRYRETLRIGESAKLGGRAPTWLMTCGGTEMSPT
jgi:hypothetical protein